MPVKKVAKKIDSNKPPVAFTPVEHLPEVLAVLGWGRSGTGKTTFASSFPKPMLLLDIREKGTDSISNVAGVKVARIEEWPEFEAVYWYLKKNPGMFKTVVIDQITTLQDLAMLQARKNLGKDEDSLATKQIFGETGGLMKTWLLNYRDLIDDETHIVFLAHDRKTGGGDEGGDDQIEPEVGPRLMPSVASFVNGMVKIIGNTYIREGYNIENKRKVRFVEYGMRVGPHAYYTTKVRSPVGIASPDSIVDPSFEKLIAIMRGDYSKTAIKKKAR